VNVQGAIRVFGGALKARSRSGRRDSNASIPTLRSAIISLCPAKARSPASTSWVSMSLLRATMPRLATCSPSTRSRNTFRRDYSRNWRLRETRNSLGDPDRGQQGQSSYQAHHEAARSGFWLRAHRRMGRHFLHQQIRKAASENIRTWGELGLTGEWASKPIQTYGYVAPGFEIAVERKLFHWSDKWNENYREYVEEKEIVPGAEGQKVASERMYEALSKDKYGIAWGPILHSKNYPDVKQIDLSEDGGPYVPLTEANVQNRTYPSSGMRISISIASPASQWIIAPRVYALHSQQGRPAGRPEFRRFLSSSAKRNRRTVEEGKLANRRVSLLRDIRRLLSLHKARISFIKQIGRCLLCPNARSSPLRHRPVAVTAGLCTPSTFERLLPHFASHCAAVQ